MSKQNNGENIDEKVINEYSNDNNPGTLPSGKELRQRLRQELMQISDKAGDNMEISPQILQSETYVKFTVAANKGIMIPDIDPLWAELENVVLKSSPQFRNNLLFLASGKLTIPEIHTALLIKCGFRPVDMSILLGKSNGAIITRRNSICMKVLDKKMSTKVINNIIRSL